ncbi:MAG: GNAT family N-acetyltransferase [Bryobacterales bacterium]
MQQHDLVEFLPWDSEFFGRRIARVKPNTVAPSAGDEILQWCADERIDCLYFLADPSSAPALAWAEDQGFRLLDIRTTLCCDPRAIQPPGPTPSSAARVEPFRPGHLAALRRIARVSHRDSRFYWDANLRDKSDDLFETWIAKSCEDYADMVLVAELDGAAAGYITLDYSSPTESRVGLFAVGPEARGRGIGHQLVQCGLQWLRSRGAVETTVVTQGRNRDALRLYQKAGLRMESLNLWYHLWLGRQQVR